MLNGPQRIVLIRAGRYDYAEVELTASLQIVGPNNTGKTTLINTLQFLYVDDLRTMDFGSYSLEQTLTYYFPNQYSYVLFECLGSTGKCVIGWRGQSKAAGGDPERFCYLGAYDTDDFFTEAHQVREPREVSARLALKEFRIIRSAQEHREILLPPEGADGHGFGIVALRDADRFRRFRESLKDLLSLSTITQEQMRERLLSLAEVRTDRPALDVRRVFGDDYDVIRRRRDALARFKKHEAQVRQLVEYFTELREVRGDLVTRWSDLRAKSVLFQQAHEAHLAKLRGQIETLTAELADLTSQTASRAAERDALLSERGGVSARLTQLEHQAKSFADFSPELARTGEQNLKNEEQHLKTSLSQAETENREKATQKVSLYSELVQHNQNAIANFDRLAVTALRRHLTDDQLGRAFRLLNFELLETPVGPDGISASDESHLLQLVKELAERVRDGVYQDSRVRIVLGRERRSMNELADVQTLRERLTDETATLQRWRDILRAIAEREQLADQLRRVERELAQLQKQLILYDEFLQMAAERPRLTAELKTIDAAISRLDGTLRSLANDHEEARSTREQAQRAVVHEENGFNEVMGRFNQCAFPELSARAVSIDHLPEDFDSAIALFLKRQERERQLSGEVNASLKLVAQLVGEAYNGADDTETIAHLQSELEALPIKTEALEKDWNALVQGLRGMFLSVLKELDAVRSAVTDLNRQFARTQVSNLQAIKLEVLDAGDLVSWIKRLVNLEQPGLFDDDTQLDQTLRNFRQKLEGSPLISYAQLFSLQFTVVGEDGVPHHYQDFRQIESHGTTITIKVLFNLLVLRRYLREEQCIVPFFLDEIQALDPANRAAVLSTSRKLGFLAITASPEPVPEVDALYFLQPQQGRIVLRQRHRVGIKLQPTRS
jgi:hypothetical protein